VDRRLCVEPNVGYLDAAVAGEVRHVDEEERDYIARKDSLVDKHPHSPSLLMQATRSIKEPQRG
jgi:hypothetical protein